jgi:hypothetical protein
MMGSILVGLFGLLIWAICGCLAAAAFVFWIWMLVDAIKNRSLTDTEKIVWVLVVIFLHFLGALIYFFVGRERTI